MYLLQCLILILHLPIPLSTAQQQCYWPDGTTTVDGGDHPKYINCYPNQDSHCCGEGEICQSNGLCYGADSGWVNLTGFSILSSNHRQLIKS